MKPSRRLPYRTLFAAVVVAASAAAVSAQIWRGGYGFREPPRFARPDTFKGGFNFCRLMFTSNRREKTGWRTDYPGADNNLSVRLSELTKVPVSTTGKDGPNYVVVRSTDDALFQCPIVVMEDGGTAIFSDEEVARLHDYLLKGGFIFATDYHGSLAREQLNDEMRRVLPNYPIVDVPMDHPIWHMIVDLKQIPQMASIQAWRRCGCDHEFRADGPPDVHAIEDDHGRVMVLMLHNSDIPDGWEREAEEPMYSARFSPDAYAVGMDVVLYAMTH
ncbi:MAG TPA: DUF4159 domain-containing protein [Vicinamibacterales bacterium]|nr:DUF4159 domain-containing protein [Vicinamibacterales bacterium]